MGWPKWLSGGTEHNIRIEAKAPAGVSPDRDNLNAMLRALMIDRYKMAVHYEDRPMDVDTLVAVKPKMTKADPANRTGCARQNEIHPGQWVVVHLDCKNMTLAQFAEQIQAYKVDLFYPVLDGTGVGGAWDFKLDYDTCLRFGQGRGQAAATDSAVAEPDDPSGAVCFAGCDSEATRVEELEVHGRASAGARHHHDHMEESQRRI